MSDQYEVLTEALREHAKKIDGFADRLAQAVDAAREMSLPTDAYGQLCQMLPAMLNPLQDIGVTALDSGARRLDTTATNVKDTAEDYARVDDDNALSLRGVR
ncbi:MAG TPA: type VII secretion target [Pseudonocardiaceae bacterium]